MVLNGTKYILLLLLLKFGMVVSLLQMPNGILIVSTRLSFNLFEKAKSYIFATDFKINGAASEISHSV